MSGADPRRSGREVNGVDGNTTRGRSRWHAAGVVAAGLALLLVGGLMLGGDNREGAGPTPVPTVTKTIVKVKKPKPAPTVTRTVVKTRSVYVSRASRSDRREPSAAQWAALRHCESGAHGLYTAATGNGYFGAYQFDLSTWRSVGGSGYPHHASPAEQDARARALYARRGAQPWPVCGRHLP